ncbi:MAG: hypothetical protein AAGD18_14185 [Actinomycetota bacterium]
MVDPRPVIAVSWRPGERPGDRLAGAVLDREVRRRLPDASIIRRDAGTDPVDGLVGEGADDAPRLPLDRQGCLPVGPLTALADGLDRNLLRRRTSLQRGVGWYPGESARAVVVDIAPGADLVLRHHEEVVQLSGGDLAARRPGAAGRRLPDVALPIDLAAAVAAAARVVTDQAGLAAAAESFGVEVEWLGDSRPGIDRGELTRVLDEFAAAAHLNALRRRPLDVIGAELRRDVAASRRGRQVDAALRRRLRATRDQLADRIVSHEDDLARLADAEQRANRR